MTSGGFAEISFSGQAAQGIYIKWKQLPGQWTLALQTDEGYISSLSCGGDSLYQEYIALPDGVRAVRLIAPASGEETFSAYELSVWSPGALPASVHHQDDELLFFGGTIPYYAGELRLDTVVVYMALGDRSRIHEAMEGLWLCGARQSPVFLGLEDKLSYSIEDARLTWDEQSVVQLLARQIMTYKPQVIVSHDLAGEYGHGQHILTAVSLLEALELAADPERAAALDSGLAAWNTPKCYLHLSAENPVVMPWDTLMLSRLGGKSALELAREGYREHVSQLRFEYSVSTEAPYDCRAFGLVRSTVGADAAKNDFFENIVPRVVNIVPSAVPDGLAPSGDSGFLFTQSSTADGIPRLLRYGSSGSAEGWYLCDRTGAVSLPVKQVVHITDLSPADVGNLTPVEGIQLPIYGYGGLFFRYGSIDGAVGWYLTDQAGDPLLPAVTVDRYISVPVSELPSPDRMTETPSVLEQLLSAVSGKRGALIACICFLAALIILAATAFSASRRGRKRGRQRRRHAR